MTTVDKHEYFKMMRAREERIRTFMQLELEACLEEVCWMLRCYNCEALELFNDWGGRGYDDSVPGEVTKTSSSGYRTT